MTRMPPHVLYLICVALMSAALACALTWSLLPVTAALVAAGAAAWISARRAERHAA